MKNIISVILGLALLACSALAAGIDGKWVSERKMERDGQSMTITQTFELKTKGEKISGKITMAMGDMEPRTTEISGGKIDGNKFSFSATMQTPNGEMKTVYEGSIDGDSLKGTSAREGGQSRPFEAKRK